MPSVTAIHEKGRSARVRVEIDDGRIFNMSRRSVREAGLKPGVPVPDRQMEAMLAEGLYRDAMDAALRFLAFRPRSETEVRNFLLRRKKCAEETAARVMASLRRRREVDDVTFARLWVEDRANFRPRSRRLLRSELRGKGIDADTVEKMVQGVDDEAVALELGRRRAARLAGLDWPAFRRKMGVFLQRREFDLEIVARVTRKVWEERAGEPSPET